MSPHRREAGSISRLALTDWESSALCDRLCVCPFVCPSLPRRQVPIPFSPQCSLVGSGTLVLDLFLYRLGPVETARCRDVPGVMWRVTPPSPTLGTERRPLRVGGTRETAGAHFLSRGGEHVSLGEGRSGVRSAESRRPSHGG